jgi:KipI family sensor histidine kinase inhibitor
LSAAELRLRPVGEAALSIELGNAIDPVVNARVRALDHALRADPFPGFRECVPTYRALLVLFDPASTSAEEVRGRLEGLARAARPAAAAGRLHEVPVRYGGEDGPDLGEVAAACGLSEAEVVARHAAREYTAFMIGFTSAFAYLGPLPEELSLPRRRTPRVRVPEGSVAIAGCQTGIYPASTPGGWHLIGRTSLRLFDPTVEPPTLFQPGDRVRFVSVSKLPERTPLGRGLAKSTSPVLEVLDGGLLTTVQDAGRFGYRRLGVVWGGAMDAPSLRSANALVANAPEAAALECTVSGPTVRFLASCRFAIVGADLGATLQRADLGDWPVPLGVPVLGRPGNVLSFQGRRAGCRAYVAFAGGIDVPLVLGSRSTDLLGRFGGFEGRALIAGDLLALCPGTAALPRATVPSARAGERIRILLGPQDDHFAPEALAAFLDSEFAVQPTSDRVGCRLSGPAVRHGGPSEIVSDGMLPGSVQIPPDGQPIVMMADSPTTGGYPKIGTVIQADLPRLAQLVPGQDRLRFSAVSSEEARRALRLPGSDI